MGKITAESMHEKHNLIMKARNTYQNLPVQLKASFWFFVCVFLQRGVSAITTPIFTRILSTSEYGIYGGAYTSWMEIVSVIVTLNLSVGGYMAGLVRYEERRERYSASMQGLLFVLCTGWGLIYFLFRNAWNNLFTLSTLQMAAMFVTIWAETAFNLWAVSERVRYRYVRLVTVTMIASILKPALSILLICLFPQIGATGRILGVAIGNLLCYTWAFFYQIAKGRSFFSAELWLYGLKYNIPLLPHHLSNIIMLSSDRIMIKNIIGSSEAGIYDLANSISSIMMLFYSAILQTLNPWIYQKIKEKQTEQISRISDPALILIAGVNVILIAVGPEVVRIFAPVEYHSAIWAIPPLAMSIYFRFCFNLFAAFELYYEKVKQVAAATMVGACLNVGLNFWLIPQFGFYAAGYTTLVSFILYAVLHFILMTRVCRTELKQEQPYDMPRLFRITGLFLLSGAVFAVSYLCLPLRVGLIIVTVILMIAKRALLISLIRPFLRQKST